LGVDDPVAAAEAIAACFEGLILHRIARHDTSDPRPTFELLVNSVIRQRGRSGVRAGGAGAR
jgi:hypothetical protein